MSFYMSEQETNLSGHIVLLTPYYPDLRPKQRCLSSLLLLCKRAAQIIIYSSEWQSFVKNSILDSKPFHLHVLQYHCSRNNNSNPHIFNLCFYCGKLLDWETCLDELKKKKKKIRFGLLAIHNLSGLQYNISSNVLWSISRKIIHIFSDLGMSHEEKASCSCTSKG